MASATASGRSRWHGVARSRDHLEPRAGQRVGHLLGDVAELRVALADEQGDGHPSARPAGPTAAPSLRCRGRAARRRGRPGCCASAPAWAAATTSAGCPANRGSTPHSSRSARAGGTRSAGRAPRRPPAAPPAPRRRAGPGSRRPARGATPGRDARARTPVRCGRPSSSRRGRRRRARAPRGRPPRPRRTPAGRRRGSRGRGGRGRASGTVPRRAAAAPSPSCARSG
jgi:hypothetical protein